MHLSSAQAPGWGAGLTSPHFSVGEGDVRWSLDVGWQLFFLFLGCLLWWLCVEKNAVLGHLRSDPQVNSGCQEAIWWKRWFHHKTFRNEKTHPFYSTVLYKLHIEPWVEKNSIQLLSVDLLYLCKMLCSV